MSFQHTPNQWGSERMSEFQKFIPNLCGKRPVHFLYTGEATNDSSVMNYSDSREMLLTLHRGKLGPTGPGFTLRTAEPQSPN